MHGFRQANEAQRTQEGFLWPNFDRMGLAKQASTTLGADRSCLDACTDLIVSSNSNSGHFNKSTMAEYTCGISTGTLQHSCSLRRQQAGSSST